MNRNEKKMPIVGYFGPSSPWAITAADGNAYVSKDTVTEQIYRLIAESGINTVAASNDAYIEGGNEVIEKQLRFADVNGLSMFVRDERINRKKEISHEELQTYLDDYEKHDSFSGLYLIDEPRTELYPLGNTNVLMDEYASLGRAINSYKNYIGYVNLFPYYEGLSGDGVISYQKYLEDYITKYQPSYMCFDYYVFTKMPQGVVDCKEYMQNLTMVRNAASKANIPFWSFVQVGSNWNDGLEFLTATTNDRPTKGELNWDVNVALAMGAKGISYFPLLQPHFFAFAEGGKMDYKRNGLIAEDGSINVWYSYVKEANTQIVAIEDVIMNAANKGVIPVGGYAARNITESLNDLGDASFVIRRYDKLQSVSTTGAEYGALVGCFDYQGKMALYVVNYDVLSTQTITLCFDENISAEVTQLVTVEGKTEAKTSKQLSSDKKLEITLGAGEASLVVLI